MGRFKYLKQFSRVLVWYIPVRYVPVRYAPVRYDPVCYTLMFLGPHSFQPWKSWDVQNAHSLFIMSPFISSPKEKKGAFSNFCSLIYFLRKD